MSEIEFPLMREINSAWGKKFTDSLANVNLSWGELCPVGKVNTTVSGYFLPCGECMYHFSYSPTVSVPVPDGQSNCEVWALLVFPVLGIMSNCLLFSYVNIHEQELMSNAYIKMNHWTLLRNKTEKEKQLEVSCENELY